MQRGEFAGGGVGDAIEQFFRAALQDCDRGAQLITAGDIIIALAGQPTTSVAALQSVLAAHKPGDRIQARFSRNGAESTMQVTLGSITS